MGGLIVCFGLVVWLFGFIADLVFYYVLVAFD